MPTATSIQATGIDIHAYLVKDPKRAIDFYRATLGLIPSWESEQGAEFELADGSTFGVWKMSDGSWHPSAGVFFAVPDIQEAIAKLRSQGIKFQSEEPYDSPMCRMIEVQDSEGNSFMLHERKKQT